jgi:sulfhydrogenase subunit alpha
MVGSIARIKNNSQYLHSLAKETLEGFIKEHNISQEEFSQNIFYNLFSQAVEVLHFLETSRQLIKEILEVDLKEERKELKIRKGAGLSVTEAPRGTLFTYFEIDKEGRVSNCNIITPTAQFLNNLEEDLRVYLPEILKLKEEEKIRKIRALIRVYDPCISCATH